MTSRRNFLKTISGAAASVSLATLPLSLIARNEIVKITILHTNDVHSHIEPFPDNHPDYPGMGGVTRRATLIKKIRSQEKNVLLFDAGDIFQGTPYFNMYHGQLELKLMSEMGYNASAIGNHDFDNGIDGLVSELPHAAFPFLNCNYDFTGTPMDGRTFPYKLFNMDGVRIGVFGLGIELEGLVDRKMYGNTRYLDPVVKANEWSDYLKNRKDCDLVICLSHLGYEYKDAKVSDVVLAKQSRNIDLIIGGHTHTLLPEPVSYTNQEGKKVYIAQVGWAGIRLGRIDFYVEKKSGKKLVAGSTEKISVKARA